MTSCMPLKHVFKSKIFCPSPLYKAYGMPRPIKLPFHPHWQETTVSQQAKPSKPAEKILSCIGILPKQNTLMPRTRFSGIFPEAFLPFA